MTVVSDIVYNAYRETGLVSEIDQLTRNQFNEGLARLNSIINSTLGYEIGEQLLDWAVGTYGVEYTTQERYLTNDEQRPPLNSRIIMGKEQAITLYLPPKPRDGSRLGIADPHSLLNSYNVTFDGNGRTIENGATLVLSTAGLERTWMYRADLADWVRYTTLAGDDEMPFPDDYDDYFIIALTERVASRHTAPMHPATQKRAMRILSKLRARYRQTQEVPLEYGLIFNNNLLGQSSFDKGTL